MTIHAKFAEHQKIISGDPEDDGRFGWDLDLDGDTIIVGAPDEDSSKGAAYIFKRSANGAWSQEAKLLADSSDRDSGDSFGYSVAVDGDIAIVGAPYDDEVANNSGAAYFFQRTVQTQGGVSAVVWSLAGKLTNAISKDTDLKFGYSVDGSDDDNIAVIAAPSSRLDSSQRTAVHVYSRSGTGDSATFSLDKEIRHANASYGACNAATTWIVDAMYRFGDNVEYGNNTILIYADEVKICKDAKIKFNRSYTYIYEKDGSSWAMKFDEDNGSAGGGISGYNSKINGGVSSDGTRIMMGGGANGAEIWHKSSGTWSLEQSLDKVSSSDYGRGTIDASGDVAVFTDGFKGKWGRGYIWERNGSAWTRTATVRRSDEGNGATFGRMSKIDGDRYAISSPRTENAAGEAIGAVYIYER